MARFKGSFKLKCKVSVDKTKDIKLRFPRLVIESGVFPDTKHYAKNISAQKLYGVLLYGSADGRIPSRNVLEFLNKYVEDNTEKFLSMYLESINDVYATGQKIGININNRHKALIYGVKSPSNAPSTIKKKGFNDPLIDRGVLVKSIAFSINGKGRFGKG